MISDSQLMKLSFAITVIGVVSLFFIVQLIEPLFVRIGDINEAMSGQLIVTEGSISAISTTDGIVFLTLSGNGTIDVVVFSKDAEKNNAYELKIDDTVRIEGRVSIYENKLEIIGEKIEKL
jgi:RecJ-like exonuclease